MATFDRDGMRALFGGEPTPHRARSAALALGGLAPWWLSAEAVAAARRMNHPTANALLGPDGLPRPSDDLGSCWVVCAVADDLRLLRTAVALPLRWVKGEAHSHRLPQALRRLADGVAAQVNGIKDLPPDRDGWGLQPAYESDAVLDDGLFETFDSGWGALAGGLIAAVLGLTPKADVWASVAWDDGHLGPVEGLTAKVATAAALGAKTFFVHWSQVNEVVLPPGIRVAAVGPKHSTGLSESLRDYFAEFSSEPPAPTPGAANEDVQFERCRQHHMKLIAFTSQAERFYHSHLLPAIIRRYRKRFADQAPGLRVRRLVTVVSFSPELIEIVVRAIQPDRVLLLHTRDRKQVELTAKYRERLERVQLENGGTVACDPGPFDVATAPADIATHIDRFTTGVSESEVVLDLKPGSKKMTYPVIAAARPGNRLLNMEPEFRHDRSNTPGTEIPELLPAISRHPDPESA